MNDFVRPHNDRGGEADRLLKIDLADLFVFTRVPIDDCVIGQTRCQADVVRQSLDMQAIYRLLGI